jgi:phosphate transport system substrate-binding protein
LAGRAASLADRTQSTRKGSMRHNRLLLALAVSGALAFGVAACGSDDSGDGSASSSGGSSSSGEKLSGKITIDGSSTVGPFTEAAAELFNEENPGVKVSVGISGTGGGFEKFCAGETDISDASRPIKEDEEAPVCKKNGVAYNDVQIANDGIAVVTSKSLTVNCLTTDQLKKLWDKGSKIKSLSEIDPKLPNAKLSLYGPDTDSGTFDFFTGAINGEEGQTREDYEPSSDDNQLVTGVSGDQAGLGYFGFSYYEGAMDKLNLVGVDAGSGCVKPSKDTIQDGSYKPLSRPLFMYPSAKAMKRPEVKAFLDFVVAQAPQIASAAKIVPLTDAQLATAKEDLAKAESAQ